MRLLLLAPACLALLLAAGCGGKEKDGPGGGKAAAEAPKVDPEAARLRAEEEAREQEAKRKELAARREEVAGKLAKLEADYKEMVASHAKEEGLLPDASKLRPRLQRLIQDYNNEKSRLDQMERDFEEVKKVAESSISGDLKTLREERVKVEAKYNDAQDSWRTAVENDFNAVVDESPVKRDLDTLRAIKEQWFELTPSARRGGAGSADGQRINGTFRSWLGEQPVRTAVAQKLLEQPEAPKGKTPATYDFTSLEFYVLLEIYEDVLDKQNVAVENKRLLQEEQHLRQIEAELDAVTEKIAGKMSEGGGDLETYEDLSSRLPGQRSKVSDLEQALRSMRDNFGKIQEAKDSHIAQQDALVKQIEAAKKELAAIRGA